METLLILVALLGNIKTEMISVGKTKGVEIHITNILGEEYYVDNYMDPVSRIMYFNTGGLPPGMYFVRIADTCEVVTVP